MKTSPIQTLRTALEDLLDGASFSYDIGNTRTLVRNGYKALQATTPSVAHEPPVGVFRYDPGMNAFVQEAEDEATDERGNLKPGYIQLFKQSKELASA